MIKPLKYNTTAEIKVPAKVIEQVIGQDHAIEIIKKAALQRRHVLLVGEPGTGKSLLGQGLAELLPKEKLVDILCFPNEQDENKPLIRVMPKGQGKKLIDKLRAQVSTSARGQNIFLFILLIIAVISPWWIREQYGDIMAAASLIGSMFLLAAFILFINLGKRVKLGNKIQIPKLLIDSSTQDKAPFIDATGAHAGALLGDVLHDPLQTGGLGTPPHERIIPGAVHRANKGVLFIDETSTLDYRSQQELLTVLQEKKYAITGQSERSSGAMTRTEPVPTDVILIAAGNFESIEKMHPALRSRIRGYGYEIYMNKTMKDNPKNRNRLVQFVAQEVNKDKKIPHFTKEAVEEIIKEAKLLAGTGGKLTVRLRELGGLVRAAGDIAVQENSKITEKQHVIKAKTISRSLEKQITDEYIENKKQYEVIRIKGEEVGRVNGLAIIGSGVSYSGIVMPIEAEVTEGGKKAQFIATGRLGEIAKEAVKNVSAIILKSFGQDIKERYDIYVQFLQTYSGVEGDSASIAVATAIVSALKNIPIKQNIAMTGSLSIRGEVLAIGGVNQKVEAAIETGLKQVIIPSSNEQDIVLSKEKLSKIKIIPVKNIKEVLEYALVWNTKNRNVLNQIKINII